MALTLVEAAKRNQNPIQSAVIEMFARNSDILRVLPFNDIQGMLCGITGKRLCRV